ncbi:hypothetical protein [Micromonospora chalcea]|uniref:hypothetical protein n=1 Tax=Micromonospora chalcea TaxID=1874 RepID=UPI003D750C1B
MSKHEPTRPIDWRTFQRAHTRAKSAEQHSLSLSLWKITPVTSPPRVTAAMFNAATTRPGHADGGTLAKRAYVHPDSSHLKVAAEHLEAGLFGWLR